MSEKYNARSEVPTDIICDRIEELSDAITKGREAVSREFTMRIPAEVDLDADLVLSDAAARLRRAMWLMGQLYDDLPSKRDWLNPEYEREMKAISSANVKALTRARKEGE
jgi:hypothetical protein